MGDPQFGMFSQDKDVAREVELFRQAIRQVNELHPRFVAICGDLTNKPGDELQIRQFKRVASTLDTSIRLYLVSGNHDLTNAPTTQTLCATVRISAAIITPSTSAAGTLSFSIRHS